PRPARTEISALSLHDALPICDRCNEAGLPHCSAHGLRKAAARVLAEAGCTAHEIGAITGHSSLAELVRYTKAADQRRLAEAAMADRKSTRLNSSHEWISYAVF